MEFNRMGMTLRTCKYSHEIVIDSHVDQSRAKVKVGTRRVTLVISVAFCNDLCGKEIVILFSLFGFSRHDFSL